MCKIASTHTTGIHRDKEKRHLKNPIWPYWETFDELRYFKDIGKSWEDRHTLKWCTGKNGRRFSVFTFSSVVWAVSPPWSSKPLIQFSIVTYLPFNIFLIFKFVFLFSFRNFWCSNCISSRALFHFLLVFSCHSPTSSVGATCWLRENKKKEMEGKIVKRKMNSSHKIGLVGIKSKLSVIIPRDKDSQNKLIKYHTYKSTLK